MRARVLALIAAATGCSLGVTGTGDDGASPDATASDVGSEAGAADSGVPADGPLAPPADAGPEGGDAGAADACSGLHFTCPGEPFCRTGTPCDACDGGAGLFFCRQTGACLPACAACPGTTWECARCDGGASTRTCEAFSKNNACAPDTGACACTDAGDCAGPSMVCAAGTCKSCGEPGSDMLVCKTGTGATKCHAGENPPGQCH